MAAAARSLVIGEPRAWDPDGDSSAVAMALEVWYSGPDAVNAASLARALMATLNEGLHGHWVADTRKSVLSGISASAAGEVAAGVGGVGVGG
eukprot:10693031-Alexandrium_andersonii.AAC.1